MNVCSQLFFPELRGRYQLEPRVATSGTTLNLPSTQNKTNCSRKPSFNRHNITSHCSTLQLFFAQTYKHNQHSRSRLHFQQSRLLALHNLLLFLHRNSSELFLKYSVRRLIAIMLPSREAVRCTVHDGTMSIHLGSESVEIPPHVLNQSQVLLDALSVADPSIRRKVALSAPQEWLQAWVSCFCNEDENLGSKDTQELLHCLLVCFTWNAAPIVTKSASPASDVFIACRVPSSTLLHCPIA
jgi:hypothetical protein